MQMQLHVDPQVDDDKTRTDRRQKKKKNVENVKCLEKTGS